MRKLTFIAVESKENSTSANTAYIYSLSVIITLESTCVCNGLVLSLYAIPLMMCILHSVHVFRKIIRIICNYFPKQQELIGPSIGGYIRVE